MKWFKLKNTQGNIILCCLWVFFFISSCSSEKSNIKIKGIDTFSIFKISEYRYLNNDYLIDEEYIPLLDIKNKRIIFSSIYKDQVDSISITFFDTLRIPTHFWPERIMPLTKDKIFFILNKNTLLIKDNDENRLVYLDQDIAFPFYPRISFINNNSIYFYKHYNKKLETQSNRNEFFNTSLIGVYDVESALYKDIYQPAPLNYFINYYYDFYPFVEVVDSTKFIISYSYSDEVFVYDCGEFSTKTIKSNDLDIKPFSGDEKNNRELVFYSFRSSKYGQVIYDKYRDLYYRLAFHGINDTINFGSKLIGIWSLIITDNDFKVLREVEFNLEEYFQHILIAPEGILVRKINEHENTAQFVLFNINQ